MSIILCSEPDQKGTQTPFNPTDNATIINNGTEYITFSKNNPLDNNKLLDPTDPLKKFKVRSIKNDSDYYLIVGGYGVLELFVGSITDTEIERDVMAVRAIKKPSVVCETKNTDNTDKNTSTYKITMIVFIVLFSFMLIGSLILYFTGMMKFHFSSVSFGHGTHY